jgi:hypothetical protein
MPPQTAPSLGGCAGETGGCRYKQPGLSGLEGASGPVCVAFVFVFPGSINICQLYTLTLSDHATVTLQLTGFLI